MISVVIPLYNKEKSIVATLQSVLAQTYTDWECIVINDGSSDNSLEVVKNFIDEFKIDDFNFQILTQDNAGVSAARNRGIEEAKGEYVAFLDGDDLWDKDFLKEMAKLIEEYPNKSIYGLGCEQIKRGDKPIISNHYYRGVSTWDHTTMAFTGSSACVRKQDAITVGLFDIRITHGEDLDMWWRLMLLHGGASDLRPYAYYIQDAENRAMYRVAPLEKHIPYYIDKYADARAKNKEFCRFFDEQMIYRLYPYLFDRNYRKEAQRLAKKLDYSQLKWTMHFRMCYPHLYRVFTGR